MKLQEYIKQERFASTGHEAMLNIIVTASWVLSELNAVMAPHEITPAQYNVLRILRGSHPETLTCTEIGNRLLDRTPDVTRLLNRLENSDLVFRSRAEHDRRIVNVGISEQGLELLKRIDPAVQAQQEALMRSLLPDEHRQLSDLLEKVRKG
ncbi:MAG: MarR family winged helix-turn-helix transcriptional regulator [Bacteroidota bacterium]